MDGRRSVTARGQPPEDRLDAGGEDCLEPGEVAEHPGADLLQLFGLVVDRPVAPDADAGELVWAEPIPVPLGSDGNRTDLLAVAEQAGELPLDLLAGGVEFVEDTIGLFDLVRADVERDPDEPLVARRYSAISASNRTDQVLPSHDRLPSGIEIAGSRRARADTHCDDASGRSALG